MYPPPTHSVEMQPQYMNENTVHITQHEVKMQPQYMNENTLTQNEVEMEPQ